MTKPTPAMPADSSGKGGSKGRDKSKGPPRPNPKGSGGGSGAQGPAGPPRNPKGKGKGKPTGKDKNGVHLLCYDFNKGTCNRANCVYKHAKASTPEERAYIERIGQARSSSPSMGRRTCYSWRNTGTCKHGNACSFLHSADTKGPNNLSGKGGGKSSGPRNRSKSRDARKKN